MALAQVKPPGCCGPQNPLRLIDDVDVPELDVLEGVPEEPDSNVNELVALLKAGTLVLPDAENDPEQALPVDDTDSEELLFIDGGSDDPELLPLTLLDAPLLDDVFVALPKPGEVSTAVVAPPDPVDDPTSPELSCE